MLSPSSPKLVKCDYPRGPFYMEAIEAYLYCCNILLLKEGTGRGVEDCKQATKDNISSPLNSILCFQHCKRNDRCSDRLIGKDYRNLGQTACRSLHR